MSFSLQYMHHLWCSRRSQLWWGALFLLLSGVLLAGTLIPMASAPTADEAAQLQEGDTAWLLAASALVMFMTPGLAFFYGGLVDHQNIISTMMQSLICLGVVGVLWVVIGFSLVYGDDCGGFIGNPWKYLWLREVGTAPSPQYAPTIPFQLFAAFQLKFAVITPALTAGGYIERFRFVPYLFFVVLFSLMVYCPVAHWVWDDNGFIHAWGVQDFAGGTVVHVTAGFSALAGCIAMGPRAKFRQGQQNIPVNVPYVILGTGLLWFGWFGFNAGSALSASETAARAFMNTHTATAAAMLMWVVLLGAVGKKPSAVGACVGALCGLIAITPACGYVTVGESLFIGGFASIACFVATWLMHKTPVDDGLDAFATHGVGGFTGSILTGVFMAGTGVVHGPADRRWDYFGYFWAANAVAGAWSFGLSFIIFKGLDWTLGLRLPPDMELYGLDEHEHGEGLYKGAGLKNSNESTSNEVDGVPVLSPGVEVALPVEMDVRERRWWRLAWIVLAAVLFAGVFVAPGAAATEEEAAMLNAGNTAWMLMATAMVMFMTPGLAFFYGGLVDHQNIIATMMQSIICLGLVGVLWVAVGFSLAFGEDGGSFIGNPWTYLWFRNVGTAPNPNYGPSIPFQLFAAFQLMFAILTPALTAGGYIERFRFAPYLLFVCLYSLVIYCPVAHWVWSPDGFIHKWGVKDFAGGTVVHMTAGFSALAGCIAIGPRQGFQPGMENLPVNVSYVVLGTGILWFGWFGFNAGSELAADEVAAQAFLNTNTATSAAMVMWVALLYGVGHKPSVVGACVGALCGLIAITPACGYVTVGESLFIGGFASVTCFVATWLMHKTPVDDGLDAFATHGVGGLAGSILTGAFMADVGVVHGPRGEQWHYFGYFWAAVAVVGAWSFVWSLLIFKGLDLVVGLRLPPEQEEFGLDEAVHGEGLYKGSGLKISDNTVAESCAEAIARLEFEKVSWLSAIPQPSRIQAALLRIMQVLQEMKPFIPDHVLARYLQPEEGSEDCDGAESDGSRELAEECRRLSQQSGLVIPGVVQEGRQASGMSVESAVSSAVSPRSIVSKVSKPAVCSIPSIPSVAGNRRISSHASHLHRLSSGSIVGAPLTAVVPGREWKSKPCAFLFARVAWPGHQQAGHTATLVDVLGRLVAIGKQHGATIYQVTLSCVSLHWGLVGGAAGMALKAVQAALGMLEAADLVPAAYRASFSLQVAVSYGPAVTSTLNAAGRSFFVIGGPDVDLATEVANMELPSRVGCSVLISDALSQMVKPYVVCAPRLWHGSVLLWQPLRLRPGSEDSQWLYSGEQMEQEEAAHVALHALLLRLQDGALQRFAEEVNAFQQQFSGSMSPEDKLTITYILASESYAVRQTSHLTATSFGRTATSDSLVSPSREVSGDRLRVENL
eukprot:EG_transcript_578